jgi:hypothetical protein
MAIVDGNSRNRGVNFSDYELDKMHVENEAHYLYIDDIRQKFSEFHTTWATALDRFEKKMSGSSFSPVESLYKTVVEMRWNEEPTKFWLRENGELRSVNTIEAFLDNMKELSYKDTSELAEQVLVHMKYED